MTQKWNLNQDQSSATVSVATQFPRGAGISSLVVRTQLRGTLSQTIVDRRCFERQAYSPRLHKRTGLDSPRLGKEHQSKALSNVEIGAAGQILPCVFRQKLLNTALEFEQVLFGIEAKSPNRSLARTAHSHHQVIRERGTGFRSIGGSL